MRFLPRKFTHRRHMYKNIKAEHKLGDVGVLWVSYFGQSSSYLKICNGLVHVKHETKCGYY